MQINHKIVSFRIILGLKARGLAELLRTAIQDDCDKFSLLFPQKTGQIRADLINLIEVLRFNYFNRLYKKNNIKKLTGYYKQTLTEVNEMLESTNKSLGSDQFQHGNDLVEKIAEVDLQKAKCLKLEEKLLALNLFLKNLNLFNKNDLTRLSKLLNGSKGTEKQLLNLNPDFMDFYLQQSIEEIVLSPLSQKIYDDYQSGKRQERIDNSTTRVSRILFFVQSEKLPMYKFIYNKEAGTIYLKEPLLIDEINELISNFFEHEDIINIRKTNKLVQEYFFSDQAIKRILLILHSDPALDAAYNFVNNFIKPDLDTKINTEITQFLNDISAKMPTFNNAFDDFLKKLHSIVEMYKNINSFVNGFRNMKNMSGAAILIFDFLVHIKKIYTEQFKEIIKADLDWLKKYQSVLTLELQEGKMSYSNLESNLRELKGKLNSDTLRQEIEVLNDKHSFISEQLNILAQKADELTMESIEAKIIELYDKKIKEIGKKLLNPIAIHNKNGNNKQDEAINTEQNFDEIFDWNEITPNVIYTVKNELNVITRFKFTAKILEEINKYQPHILQRLLNAAKNGMVAKVGEQGIKAYTKEPIMSIKLIKESFRILGDVKHDSEGVYTVFYKLDTK
ncbi:MAG: hypothetical protein PHV30_02320 [Candidatus Margulisbacteria bacterium]|nr:hypothetical protein [Candidatus Margulisiibacteriota bacterium]